MKNTLTLIAFLALSLLIGIGLSSVVPPMLIEYMEQSAVNFISYTVMMGGTIIALTLFSKIYSWTVPSFMPRPGKLNFSLILISMLAIEAMNILAEPIMSMIPESFLDGMYEVMDGGLWSVVTIIIAAPILEEFLFRGILQQNFTRFLSPYWGIVVASVLFGAIHVVPQQVIMATFSGLVIGAVFYLSHSLMTAVIIHLLNNGLAYLFTLYFGREMTYRALFNLSDKGQMILYGICGGFILCMTVIAVLRIEKKR